MLITSAFRVPTPYAPKHGSVIPVERREGQSTSDITDPSWPRSLRPNPAASALEKRCGALIAVASGFASN